MSHSFYKGYSSEGDIWKNVNCTKYVRVWFKLNKKPLKTVWPDCKAATKFEKIDWEQA